MRSYHFFFQFYVKFINIQVYNYLKIGIIHNLVEHNLGPWKGTYLSYNVCRISHGKELTKDYFSVPLFKSDTFTVSLMT